MVVIGQRAVVDGQPGNGIGIAVIAGEQRTASDGVGEIIACALHQVKRRFIICAKGISKEGAWTAEQGLELFLGSVQLMVLLIPVCSGEAGMVRAVGVPCLSMCGWQ